MPKGIKGIQKGQVFTEEHRKNLSLSHLGQVAWNKGIYFQTNDALKVWRENGGVAWNKGKRYKSKPRSLETRKKMSDIAKQRIKNGTHNWIDNNKTSESQRAKKSSAYRIWRGQVFKRDNWTCRKCGVCGGILHPHHIWNFISCVDLRFLEANGITLCKKCHKLFHSQYGTRNNNDYQILEFILGVD